MQDGHAVASRSLSSTERSYVQIEKELLAVVFEAKQFHQYVYGRPISVDFDHKPLEIILKKPLHDAPERLQRMKLALQGYDINLHYVPGRDVPVADALSRAISDESEGSQAGENSRATLYLEEEFELVNMAEELPFSDPALEKIRSLTAKDASPNPHD